MKRSLLVVATLLLASSVWACPFGGQKDDKKMIRAETKAQVLAAVEKSKTVKTDGKAGVK